MFPEYRPGDHVLTWNWSSVKKGDVVVFRSRRNDRYKFFLKRIDKFVDNYLYVSGDNCLKSAKVAPIGRWQIVGRVILKY